MRLGRDAQPHGSNSAALLVAIASALSLPGIGAALDRVSLETALSEARAANARLPLPALEMSIASEKETEARAERWLKVAVEGDFVYAPYPGYSPALTNLGNARLQAVVRQPVYAGGALKAGVARARAGAEAAQARYRMVEKDLELEVRSRFSEVLEATAEVEIRRAGLEQLDTYRSSLRSRQASGQGVSADLLKTEVRYALEEATLSETEQRRDEARLSLNDLMGRDPTAPLELEPLPPPEPPSAPNVLAWRSAPEISAAEAAARSAEADEKIAQAERRPHLLLTADAGFWTADTTSLGTSFWDRLWRTGGYSIGLAFVWPIWDNGAARARVTQARLGLESARLALEVERRGARLEWEKARAIQARLYRQIEILSRAEPDARDSYLDAESRYRGGTGTALDVLEAHGASVDAAVRRADAIARYRVAEAVAERWGTP